jgi:predicted dehydrogenase
MPQQKRIAFVDYKLDNFHANTYLKAIRQTLKDRGFTVSGCHALEETKGREWAKKNDIPYFSTAQELNDHADYYCILAPSNPETHLNLARLVLPFGKPTYIDKTFAPDLKTAHEIFDLADQHHTKIQTSSALRYTDVQQHVIKQGKENLKHITTWGGGSSFAEYAIHPLEMAISCLGPGATSLLRRGTADYSQLLINFTGDRTATINVYTQGNTPFAASLTTTKKTEYVPVNTSTLFTNMASAILDFFDKGEPQIDRAESLLIRHILDVAQDPRALKEFLPLT